MEDNKRYISMASAMQQDLARIMQRQQDIAMSDRATDAIEAKQPVKPRKKRRTHFDVEPLTLPFTSLLELATEQYPLPWRVLHRRSGSEGITYYTIFDANTVQVFAGIEYEYVARLVVEAVNSYRSLKEYEEGAERAIEEQNAEIRKLRGGHHG